MRSHGRNIKAPSARKLPVTSHVLPRWPSKTATTRQTNKQAAVLEQLAVELQAKVSHLRI